jgi:hypothetical protein
MDTYRGKEEETIRDRCDDRNRVQVEEAIKCHWFEEKRT